MTARRVPLPGEDLAAAWDRMAEGLDDAIADARAADAGHPGARRDRGLVLVGPMGAGKTTVGRALAAITGLAFVDTDELFTQVHGPIPAFFAAHGEPAFRTQEARVVVHAVSRPEPCVVSLGGGAVLSAQVRAALARTAADVVYLRVGEAEALRRLDGGAGRPVLAGDPAGTWSRILAEREPLYLEAADHVADATHAGARALAWRIVEDTDRPPRSDPRP